MDKIMYEVCVGLYPAIIEVVATRTTKSSVWLKGRQGYHSRLSSYKSYFDTYEEAYKYQYESAQDDIHTLENKLKSLQGYLESHRGKLQRAIEFTKDDVIKLKEGLR